jgi:hypothetical protein
VLWDTCRYIRRMQARLDSLPHACTHESWLYERGTHFAHAQLACAYGHFERDDCRTCGKRECWCKKERGK